MYIAVDVEHICFSIKKSFSPSQSNSHTPRGLCVMTIHRHYPKEDITCLTSADDHRSATVEMADSE